MKLRELINKVGEEEPNSFSEAKLISFVNEIEAEVAKELRIETAPVYEDNHTDLDKTLLAPAPYDRLYTSYLKSMINYTNKELDAYMNDQAQHNQDFRDFVDWVVRTGQAAVNENAVRRFKNIF